MIVFSALYIYAESIKKIILGIEIHNVGTGAFFVCLALLINFLLGYFLTLKGNKYKSVILEANGKHILTDCLTTFGVIISLVLVQLTGISLFDPLIAIITATNILWTGWKLIQKSIKGLMDQTDPLLHKRILAILIKETADRNLTFHHLRHRMSGYKIFIEFHLLFSEDISLEKAHDVASIIEKKLHDSLNMQAEIFSHLEPKMYHDEIHKKHGLLI